MNTHAEYLRLLQRRNHMDISNESLYQYLIYSSPIYYTEDLFPVKKIIKMPYLDFLFYCHNNVELAKEFNMPFLPYYYSFALRLLQLVFKDQEVLASSTQGGFRINGNVITADQFDDAENDVIGNIHHLSQIITDLKAGRTGE